MGKKCTSSDPLGCRYLSPARAEILSLDMGKAILKNWKTAELEKIATESRQG